MISIITATLNSEHLISTLISSLSEQSDKRFEWIIVDGNSKDNTLKILNNLNNIDLTLISENDNGIYDAINKGIKLSKYNYYLVCGSDDYLFPNTIENLNKLINANLLFDFYAMSFQMNNKVHFPKKYTSWLYGMRGMSSCHSVALLINKNLHTKFGFYNLSFPIFADQLFVQDAFYQGSTILHCRDIVSGIYSTNGISSKDSLNKEYEFFKMQLEIKRNFLVQYLLFIIRILKFKFFNKF
jgi:glycosyltransferase involved in cell wall biosynthesis